MQPSDKKPVEVTTFENDPEMKEISAMPDEARVEVAVYRESLMEALMNPDVTREQFAALILYGLSHTWIHGRNFARAESLKECEQNCPSGKTDVATVASQNEEES